MTLSDDERDLLALHLVTGIGPRLTAALLDHFGSASAVLHASIAELLEIPYLGTKIAESLQRALEIPDVDKEAEQIDQHGVHLRVMGRAGYPGNLATIEDAPHLLFCKGTLEPRDELAIAIVGSRACTTYGRRVAERIGADLARAGWTVVSGLARGIDGCAHRGALSAKGRTIAVLAGGLSKIYPPEHADLAAAVAASGALVTESCMLMEPMATLFPARNRIISGLSRAVVVIEAAERSGALITARLAAEQGREVFAVPGPVDSSASAGSLQLVRNGAKMVRSADDILEDLQALPALTEPTAHDVPVVAQPPAGLDDVQQKIWNALAERRMVDDLAFDLSIPISELTRQLTTLELKKVIRRLPGNCYERF
ncbi:MAG: DNA-protecting protein DprA [Planctomycetes bacterium]|nr:DNA-protecting protein DprA [Planctomycetota bacterium]